MKSAKELVAEAAKEIETLTGAGAVKLVGHPNVVFVDVREGEEVATAGTLRGAVHGPRGFLEFQADPGSPSHRPELRADKRLVLFCASGNRSALAAKALVDMGFENVAHIAGGFSALQTAGAPIER